MVQLWKESEQASGNTHHQIQAITKSAFLALSEEDKGSLLDDFDFLIVKDTNVLPECLPQSVTILSAS